VIRFLDDEDLRLIRAAKQGDPEAFTVLVKQYKNYVYKTAFGVLGTHTDAEDVGQEAFVQAFLSLSRLHDERAFPSWIATITTRLALVVIRKRERTKSLLKEQERVLAESQQDQMERVDRKMLLFNLMQKLNDEARTIFILREIHGRSYQEIADTLSIPVGTVRSRLHAARLQMRMLVVASEKEESNDDV